MNRRALITLFFRYEPYILLTLVYFLAGRLGLSIEPVGTFATFVWPASAVALAALLLWGYRLWPAVFIGAALVNLSDGATIFAALMIGAGNALEALAGAYFLNYYVGFQPSLLRLRDNIGIIATAFIAPLLSASIGIASLWASGARRITELPSMWGAWWAGDALGILILAPLLLKWFSRPRFERTAGQYIELTLLTLLVFATSLFIFWLPQSSYFTYYVFIPLTWVALRTGPRGMSLSIALAALVALCGTLLGHGPFANGSLFQLAIFSATMGTVFLTFTAIVEERKHAQQELARHVTELETTLSKISSEDEAKKNFLAMLAHELRNPLAAILSSAELLRLESHEHSESALLVNTIGQHVNAMRGMLDDVLDISRISRNKLALRKEVVFVEDIVDRSVESTKPLLQSRGHRLHVHKPEEPLYMEADPIRVEQILVNLLNNAAKYTNPGGTIELSLRDDKNMAVLTLRDNGIGISRTMQKRIFEPFFQVQRGKLPTEGLGVGLPLTRQLVEMHGGTIEVKSEGEGKGSEFTVRLPLIRGRVEKPAKKPILTGTGNRTLRAVRNKRSILVVDDNEAAAHALKRLLELRGHEVHVAYSGLAALEAARMADHDILVLDIGLPDIDGYEVVRRLKQDNATNAALIALTGYGQTEDKEKAHEAGFHYHLTKPVGLKELEKAFKKALSSTAAASVEG